MIDKQKLIAIAKAADIEADISADDFGLSFKELGLDSLDVFNLLSEVDAETGVSIPDEDFETINTFSDIMKYVNDRL